MPTVTKCSIPVRGSREGGHSGWLRNNLETSEEAPEFHAVTAQWTFKGQWDPEQRIRDLWSVLAY